jgi:hypothetical protein
VPPVISGLAEGVTPKIKEVNQRHLDLYQQLLDELDGQKPNLSSQVDEVIFDGGDGLKLRVHEGRVAVLVGTKDFRKPFGGGAADFASRRAQGYFRSATDEDFRCRAVVEWQANRLHQPRTVPGRAIVGPGRIGNAGMRNQELANPHSTIRNQKRGEAMQHKKLRPIVGLDIGTTTVRVVIADALDGRGRHRRRR